MKRMRGSYIESERLSLIDCKKARVILSTATTAKEGPGLEKVRKEHLTRAKRAHKLINILERKVGWTLTKTYELHGDNIHPGNILFMFVGCGKWLRSQHMLSMYLLLLRFFFMNDHLKNVNSFKDLEEIISKYREGKSVPTGARTQMDAGYVGELSQHLAIMKHFDNIFKGLPMSRNYSIKAIGNLAGCFQDGISSLLHGRTKDKELLSRVRKYI